MPSLVAAAQPTTAVEGDGHLGLLWMAPFLSGGGYCSEAISFIVGLKDRLNVIIGQHGDSFSSSFVNGLPLETRNTLVELNRKPVDLPNTVVVCHSEPGAWAVPKPLYQTSQCPPHGAVYAVGRTMFETDRCVFLLPLRTLRCQT